MWEDLTMSQRADVIKTAVKQGIRNLNTIKTVYNNTLQDQQIIPSIPKVNNFAEGGFFNQETTGQEGIGDNLRKLWTKLTYDDLASKGVSFGDAFKQARSNSEKYFKWNGKLFNTNLAPTILEKQELNIPGLTRSQRAIIEDTWNYLRQSNVSARNAAALMGNIMHESSFIPTQVQKGGDQAVGLFQMHGARLKDYQNYLRETKKSDNSHSQIDYMIDVSQGKRTDFYINEYKRVKKKLADAIKEGRTGTKDYKDTLEHFNKTYAHREKTNTLYPIKDLAQAWEDDSISLGDLTDLFTNTVERAGKPMYESRKNYANQFYNHFYGIPKISK